MKKDVFFSKFFEFLAEPTAYHAVAHMQKGLEKNGFHALSEEESWNLKMGGKYFLAKEGTLIAFIMPKEKLQKATILASHTDSPSLKLKPSSYFVKESIGMLGVEVYGAPLLSSWLNRDLGIAGKILFEDKKGVLHHTLFRAETSPVVIPQLAIHLDREVNEKGLLLNKQEHLNAIATITPSEKEDFLLKLLKKERPAKKILAHDLFLYPLEKPAFVGENGDLIASYRLDSLASVFSIFHPFLSATASKNTLNAVLFTDHEEIGSDTATGAASPLLMRSLERVFLSLKQEKEALFKILAKTLLVSCDLGHTLHPNYPDKHDPRHKLAPGSGIMIKTSAEKRYATDVLSIKPIVQALKKGKIPYQIVAGRSDLRSGTTIGPIQAALTGIQTVDLGIGELSMHSARELAAKKDIEALTKLSQILLAG